MPASLNRSANSRAIRFPGNGAAARDLRTTFCRRGGWSDGGTLYLDNAGVVALLVEAVKELTGRVGELERRLDDAGIAP